VDAPGKRSSPGAWKRLFVVLACLVILAVVLARGAEQAVAPKESDDLGNLDAPIPLPPMPKGKAPAVRARGAYQLLGSGFQVTLELMRGRNFHFLSTRGRDVREATGTWSLTGSRLTLAYREVDGTSVGEEPTIVVNEWRGTTIELKNTGLPGPVVLRKRTMIRGR